ncbi:MAG: histidinol-phosphate transaminase, partial [Streptosporangiaceae bacterium]
MLADLAGRTPSGAPQIDARVRLNTNENPFPPSASLAREIGAAAGGGEEAESTGPERERERRGI